MDLPRLRIIHLEDNPYDAELIARELRRGGIDALITHVATETAFRAAVGESDVDIILADYNLPAFDGMAALEIAREAAPDAPFLFVSGAIGEERAIDALRRGATDYIIKDRISRLPSAILRALAERRDRLAHNDTQEALRLSQERIVLLSQATLEVVWDWTVGSETFWANEAMVTEWGHDVDPSSLRIDWWLANIHPAESERVLRDLQATVDSGATRWQFAYRFRRADGRYRHAEDHGIIIRDPSGRGVRLIGAMQDVTARVEAERELEQEQRVSSLGRIAAVITHEFNNVLMGIQPLADVLKKRCAEDPVAARVARQITSAVARGRQITRDILRAANPGEPALETVDASAWLVDTMADIAGLLPPSVAFTTELPSSPLMLHFDPQQMHQVITNLVLNARDAMRGAGELSVAMTIENFDAVITVADNGSGIAEDVLPRIFDPLFTTKTTGTGLGLSVAKQIVTKNGGRITVDSISGAGTIFTITMPLVAAPEQLHEPRSIEASGAVRPTVQRLLMVEDDPMIVEGMRMLLELEGFTVRCVGRAAEVAQAVNDFVPEAVILDLSLPDGHGADVYRFLAAAKPDLPVIFASGDAEPEVLREWSAAARVAFLSKPYDVATLLDRLHRITT